MTAVPRESITILSPEPDLELCRAASRVAGRMRETDAMTISEDIVDAAATLKRASWLLIPPARKQLPRIYVVSHIV